MTLFGAYDRELLGAEGLLTRSGCGDSDRIRIIADSDQRTRETGKALAAGLAPECGISVTALTEGSADPLFHPLEASVGSPNKALAVAAVAGRIGANPEGLVTAYRSQLKALDEVLRACNLEGCRNGDSGPASIFQIPATLGPGKSDHLLELRSPLNLASTMTENLLLEYAEGMKEEDVGWGRVDAGKLRELLELHTAQEDIAQRTPYIARAQSSNLLSHMLQSMQQAAEGHAVSGALSKPEDRLLILVGHDTNVANISGALGLSWLIDGRRDDTPPGGALVFELWKRADVQDYAVRVYYTAQTLDQMRNESPLSLTNPPERVALFVPGCGQSDGACAWSSFQKAVTAAIDPSFVTSAEPSRQAVVPSSPPAGTPTPAAPRVGR